MELLKKANKSRLLIAFALLAIFLFILYCNHLTPLQGDDYCYLYSCKDNSRISSVWDILVSMYYHRFTTNGRVIPHFFTQLLLMYPKPIFNVINAAMFSLCIYLMYSMAFVPCRASRTKVGRERERESNLLLLCALFGAVWVLTPYFGEVYLWLDGSCNYLWCYVVTFFWLLVMAWDFYTDIRMKFWQEILFTLLCLVVGNYSENSSVASVFMFMLFIALSLFYRKRPLKRWYVTGFIAMLAGFALLALAPAELKTKIAEPSVNAYIKNFFELVKMYLRFWPLLVFYVLAYIYSFQHRFERDTRILSLVLIGGSLAAHFVLVFALYPVERTTVLGLQLLLMSCSLLFQQIFHGKATALISLTCAVLMCFTAYRGYVGLKDLRVVRYRWDYNDTLLREATAKGEDSVRIPYIIPDTEYSVFYVWGYIRESPKHYYNVELAKYHGLSEITGYMFYDTD